MPKEITHWLVATKVLDNLHNSRLKAMVSRNRDYYLMGAVIYDSPYSYPGLTSKQKEFRKIANQLHGVNGENVLQPFQNLVTRAIAEPDEKLLAFALGVFTHVVTDSVFHPMVYYFTGNYYSEDKHKQNQAVSNHRWLETRLDLWFLDKLQDRVSLDKKFLRQIVGGTSDIASLLENFCREIPVNKPLEKGRTYKNSLTCHSFFQRLFFNGWLRLTLTLLLGKKHKLVALFYPAKISFKGELGFSYLHPITGEEIETSFLRLWEEACEKIEGFIREIDELLNLLEENELGLDEFFSTIPTRSLQTSMFGEKPSEMKFFSSDFHREMWEL